METMDEKLTKTLEGMRAALSEGEKARFRDFWRLKKECLDLFKEEMHPTKRSLYWAEYTALLEQAHELQRILDEQMNFQIEQIELAIESLETEIREREERISGTIVEEIALRFLKGPLLYMRKQIAFYHMCQEKILSLRKEILDLEMRISQKNKILARLSQLGDIVFPEKKRLVPEFSKAFDHEVANHFPLRRDRIKQCQTLLKILPLTNEIYRSLREKLSEAWDASHVEEKQKREEVIKVQKEGKEKNEKMQKAIAAIEELADKAKWKKGEGMQEEYDLHRAVFEAGVPTKRETIAFKHFSLIIRNAFGDTENLREETHELIELMRKEMNQCGLDIEFAMKLKELIRENRERIESMESSCE